MNKLKIAIDSGPLRGGDSVRGIGVYTRELLGALKITGVDISGAHFGKYNIVHFTRFNPFVISVPFLKPKHTRFVLTIYDLIPLIYPDHYPPGVRGWLSWEINKFLIGKYIDAVVTISETSKKDICRFIGISPKKVFVTYLAPRKIFKKLEIRNSDLEIIKRYHLPNSFALYVGDINYNKNIPLLVEACKAVRVSLVICGKQAKEIGSLDLSHPELRHLKNVDWSGVIRPGFVPDEDLVKIYNLATLYIQPSLYEGFGLPVLEAHATGCPVISSRTQALVEIAEDAVVFADPKSLRDFSEKLRLLLDDPSLRSNLIRKGFENAEKYSWKKTANDTLAVYDKIASEN